METDIQMTRDQSKECASNTLCQRKEPPVMLPALDYPFQQLRSDYFTMMGRSYVTMVDRYSGWPSVHRARKEDSKELIGILKEQFETFGVPEVLTTDGGSTYTSIETTRFLEEWGVVQRTLAPS